MSTRPPSTRHRSVYCVPMQEPGAADELDPFLSRSVRTQLEDRYWRPIEAQATLEMLAQDPTFFANPGRHPAIFADHGVVHVRDVALGMVRLLDTINGVLVPRRPPDRHRFMQALGVALAYIHDIGMVDMTAAGRRVHAVFAAQEAFAAGTTRLAEELLASGPVAARLAHVAALAPFATPVEVVVRELLSLAVGHSKSTIPADVLNDRSALRRVLQRIVFTPLAEFRAGRPLPTGTDPAPIAATTNTGAYDDPAQAFAWLDARTGPQADLADDVVDVVRTLRAADVLRQRGTVLRTSGGFELCMDAATARAVCTLRPATGDAAYVLIYDDDRGAGEANISAAFVTPRGDLRIAFHRGAFGTVAAAERAARSVADVIVDIQADVIPSFARNTGGTSLEAPTRSIDDVRIQLERPDDRPGFADEVAGVLATREPALVRRLVTVGDTQGAAPDEQQRFLAGEPVDPAGPEADELLGRMSEHGVETVDLDRSAALAEACRVTIQRGEVVVARGSPPAFVYVATGPGLVVRPHGGYSTAPLAPWVPVGTTGVIRRAPRNSDIVAERAVDVIMIPGELYARAWLRPLRPDQLEARLRAAVPTP